MADSTLTAIRTKVRRLTRSPSQQQLADADIDEYVNTFVLYDFPEHLRLFTLRSTFEFVTSPYIDKYSTNTTDPNDPFFDFKERFISLHAPIYIAGFKTFFSQDREQFFGIYPQNTSIKSIGTTGNGATTNYTGTITEAPIVQEHVLFSSVGANNVGLSLVDVPVVDANGNKTTDGNLYVPGTEPAVPPTVILPTNTINYVTGVFNITFSSAPASGQGIFSESLPYVAARPQALLYYENEITLRPVPDIPYRVSIEAYVRPTELLATNQSPELEQWWQYIAYGASKKIFEDRMDTSSVQQILPEFNQQERLVLRRTIVQQTNDRTATIYTEQTGLGSNWWFGSGGPF